ncbi:HEAT repeat domain-containing protein [Paenibacillus qinlingensis]|uniref:HEAT repeat protein n=1 Tax=Paenibacillus qinlingensis TaxID=1837343 RepID=A0ABU1NT38_9BACL|nr:HEAT repeat domain-containing protein [Paenibacillus qinlingensis]MDR6550598.1 HEAT repeat protein [Paenibacillus qinlingensis]
MSIDLLFELQHEVRRLFIAGSGMAAGDLRLQKMLPNLQKLGESAPVFNRVAQGVSQVLEAETSSSASRLLELGTLLNSVLYTQGKTETKETLVPVEGTGAKLSTTIAYRKLSPLIEALTQKGQGRMEQIRQGYEDGLFHDLRVIPAAVSGLDDSYAEIPEYLHRTVLPSLGMEALPALQQQFKLDGGKGDARRLNLIHDLLGLSALDLLLEAAGQGSTEVRSTAIELLGDYPEQEEFIVEQADDKKKEIRRAAFLALSRLGTEQAVARLYKALESKDRDLAIEPIQLCRANDLTLRVIGHAESLLERFVQRTNDEEAAQQLLTDIRSLQGKRVPEVVHFLEKLLTTPSFIIPQTEAVQEAAAELLLQVDLPEADRFAVTLHELYNRKFISYSFRAAIKILPPDDVYERFYHDLKDKKQTAAKDLLLVLRTMFPSLEHQMYYATAEYEAQHQAWDPRWVHLFVKLDETELVCRLAHDKNAQIAAYLVEACRKKPDFFNHTTNHCLLALFRMPYKEAPELLMEILEKGKKQMYYFNHAQGVLLKLLPRTYSERLQLFAQSVSNEYLRNQLLDIVETIAAKPEHTEPTDYEEKGQGLWGWIKSKMS